MCGSTKMYSVMYLLEGTCRPLRNCISENCPLSTFDHFAHNISNEARTHVTVLGAFNARNNYCIRNSIQNTLVSVCTGAEFLDEVQTKVLRVFLLAIQSHLYSFSLRFLFLQTHATSYSFYSSATVHCKGGRRKT